jgi:hypothetical protein
MIRRRIWIAFSLVSLTTVFAQPYTNTRVTVQITDVTGAGVPRAIVEVIPSPNAQTLTYEADGNGKAEFELSPGNYDLHVESQGFCPFRRFLEPLNEQNRVVMAKLQVASCPGPCAGPCVTVYSESGIPAYPKPVAQDVKDSQGLLKVIVTDTTGTVIQPASVEVTSTSPGEFGRPWSASTRTNTLGEASLVLPMGDYVLSVTANGFNKWSTRIEGRAHLNQAIRAKLLAQSAAHSHFAISVKTTPGVVIPGVMIEAIDPGWGSESQKRAGIATTDADGNAELDLAPGHGVYMVSADTTEPGGNSTLTLAIGHFECSDDSGPGWSQKCTLEIDTSGSLGRAIKITATVGPLPCTLCIDDKGPTIPVEPVEFADLIPRLPLSTLGLLPARSHKSLR